MPPTPDVSGPLGHFAHFGTAAGKVSQPYNRHGSRHSKAASALLRQHIHAAVEAERQLAERRERDATGDDPLLIPLRERQRRRRELQRGYGEGI